MNLHHYKGIVIQKNWKGTKEGISVHTTCLLNKIPVRWSHNIDPLYDGIGNDDYVKDDEIAVGDVWFCPRWVKKSKYRYEKKEITPDYYPESLSKYIHRKITVKRVLPKEKCFIKPCDYKSFTGFVYDPSSDFKINSPFRIYCSEIVNFVDEWRYYVTDGKVVYSSWYKGSCENWEILPEAPCFDGGIPEGFSGTIDIGITDTFEWELVECHHPYACGWYGNLNPKDMETYTQWLIDGQKYIDSI